MRSVQNSNKNNLENDIKLESLKSDSEKLESEKIESEKIESEKIESKNHQKRSKSSENSNIETESCTNTVASMGTGTQVESDIRARLISRMKNASELPEKI